MLLREIRLQNFRNYEKAELCFKPGLTLIRGANGQGKSNLLEAIYSLCFAGSFRQVRDEEMVRFGSSFYYLCGNLLSNELSYQMEVGYAALQKRKVVKVNGNIEKRGKFNRVFPVVFFVPEDLEIVRRGPEERRRFLDRELCQLSSAYAADLNAYRRALLQKNRLLREQRHSPALRELLSPWNRQLVKYGSRIIAYRNQIIQRWAEKAGQNYRVLFRYGHKLEIIYHCSLAYGRLGGEPAADAAQLAELMSREIKARESEERARGYALVGPHRDDLFFFLDRREARKFASHGQQRGIVIALKAAQVQYYGETMEKPLFMIDDIFSELDEERRRQCLLLFEAAAQVLMTVTGENKETELYLPGREAASLYIVQSGTVKEAKLN